MPEESLSIEKWKELIRGLHHADARMVETVETVARQPDGTPWRGQVHVFELIDHPNLDFCYCFRHDGADFVSPHIPGRDSPEAAVNEALLST